MKKHREKNERLVHINIHLSIANDTKSARTKMKVNASGHQQKKKERKKNTFFQRARVKQKGEKRDHDKKVHSANNGHYACSYNFMHITSMFYACICWCNKLLLLLSLFLLLRLLMVVAAIFFSARHFLFFALTPQCFCKQRMRRYWM